MLSCEQLGRVSMLVALPEFSMDSAADRLQVFGAISAVLPRACKTLHVYIDSRGFFPESDEFDVLEEIP